MKKIFYIYLLSFSISMMVFFACSSTIKAADDSVRLTADRLVYEQDKKIITMSGNVRFMYKNTTLSGENATFNTDTRIGIVEGNVRIYQPGTTIVGDKMTVYYNKKYADLSGHIKMVTIKDVTSSPGEKQDKMLSGLTTLTCDKFTYNWIIMEGKATGNVYVEQKDRRAYSDRAHYSGVAELITLEDKVRFEQGSNNWVTCQKAYIDLQKETFMAVGGVTGNFIVQTEEEKAKTKTQEKKAPPKNSDKIIIPELPYKERILTE